MTKIAITPNASGTGTFAITAPSSNTNRTFTLPDESGEVLTDAQNDPAKLFRQDNILGTVSESSGTPTGAVIERGSNANGEFVRYADGTQVCWSRATVTQSSTSRLVKDQTFPAEFSSFGGINVQVSVPVHSNSEFTNLDRLTVKSWGPAMGSGTATTTDVGITVFTDSGAVSADSEISNVNVNATGRWF